MSSGRHRSSAVEERMAAMETFLPTPVEHLDLYLKLGRVLDSCNRFGPVQWEKQ